MASRPELALRYERRVRVEQLLWRLLTAVVFAGTLAMLFVRPAAAAERGWDGQWRVTIAAPGGELPFGLAVKQGIGGRVSAVLLNPPERMVAEQVTISGDTLVMRFPSYGSVITLKRGADDRLTGEAALNRSSGPISVALAGTRGAWRFFPTPARPAADLTGKWIINYGAKNERGLAEFRQAGNRVSGSVQLASGDFRYLAGEISGGRLALSTFDGNTASLWNGQFSNGALTGQQFTASGKTGSPWTARRAGKETMEAVAVEKPPVDRVAFRFPDSKGRMVSLSDAKYRGKVVVVTLGGAWCPNCHDEARFMAPYASRRQGEGLEMIGLQFEYGDDPARAFKMIDGFKARYKLPYPLLLAGQPTPESSKAALPGVGPVKVYPSTLFIGRDGRLREIHVGWAGPATGALNVKAKRDFDATVTRLLREKA